jgi:hypothetical protein
MCIQFGEEGEKLRQKHIESPDCLFLNVYAPAHPAQEKLPVLVWIRTPYHIPYWSLSKLLMLPQTLAISNTAAPTPTPACS